MRTLWVLTVSAILAVVFGFSAFAQAVGDEVDPAIVIPTFTELGDKESSISNEDIQDDGSFEILNALRNTELENGKTYGDWEEFSRQTKIDVAAKTETTEDYEGIRSTLGDWRDLFLSKESLNSSQISTLNGQISALKSGSNVDAEGNSTDTSELVTLRIQSLEKERSVLKVPSLAAAEAYELATGLIREIDRIINSRKRQQFVVRSPSPVWPTHWAAAAEYLYDFVAIIPNETRVAWHKQDRRENLLAKLPVLGLYLSLSLIIFLRTPTWSARLRKRSNTFDSKPLKWIVLFVLNSVVTLAPLFAVVLFFAAVSYSDLLGSHGMTVVAGITAAIVFFLIGQWLGQKMFPRDEIGLEIVDLSAVQRIEGRFYSTILGLILGIATSIMAMFALGPPDVAIQAVLVYPMVLGIGLFSFRLAQLFREGVTQTPEEEAAKASRGFRNQVVDFTSRLVMVPAVLGPIVATIGYFNAAHMITYPLIPSLALLSFLLILHRLANALYDVVAGRKGASTEAILPVLFGFFLALVSLPFFAIIIGVRPARVWDFWSLLLNGFTVGSTRISPTVFLLFIAAFGTVYMVTRLVQGALRSSLLPKTKMDIGGQNAVVSGIGYVGISLAALAAVTVAGIDLSALAIVAGALSVGIGFGLQNIVSNFVSGIILLVERPISEGDWIETSVGQMGIVRDISVRSTRIETFDRTDVIIPNGDLVSGVVTNWTRGNSIGRLILPVGVSYDSDSKQVEQILLDVAQAHPMVLAAPAPTALFRGFGASSLDFELRIILRDINWKLSVQSDLNHEILKRFNEAGISIPFPQSDLWLRNPEAFSAATTNTPPEGSTE